jgi:ABC-2 type transport system ATP-binding protein
LLIFDEPFSGFDPINVNILKEEILNLKKNGSTIIFSTHNMASVEELCDNIALINKSKKVLDGNVQDIKQQFKQNVYDLHFKGNFDKFSASVTADYKIESVRKENGNTICRVKLLNETTTNQLLSAMLQYGEIVGMNEVIPSINDIFIQVVEESSNDSSKQLSNE